LEKNGDKGKESTEKFAGELDAGIVGGHRFLRHGELFFTENIVPKTGTGHDHFGQAGDDGEDEIPRGEASECEEEKSDSDDRVEEQPEGGIESGIAEGRLGVNVGIDVIALQPGEGEKEDGEEAVEDLHFEGIDY